ncbi:YfgM family protein [Alteromonas oceanisediminis]|uniref:YfgM family protein n=1 Tax=Alteromonas oceanisediminis TaxID=2836180 RepID=UPI001BD92364|nr:tetratricopeptide repeat protein [Alteromonas oceanisediminis]MBT0585739.1 tetratricopeptide repeat protein [Alteromonas oceanisediminis]
MEQFATEEQQVEAIKRFWKDNGIAIIVGAVIGLGGLWGWRYYSESQISAKEATSLQYQNVVENLQANGNMDEAAAFIRENAGTGYAPLAALVLAQQAVDAGDFAQASEHLRNAADSTDGAVSDVAKLRLARVLLAQNEAQQALDTLLTVSDEAFDAQVEAIKGDAYVVLADFDKARLAYSEAVAADANNRVVKMKLDNLAVASGS